MAIVVMHLATATMREFIELFERRRQAAGQKYTRSACRLKAMFRGQYQVPAAPRFNLVANLISKANPWLRLW